MGMIQKKTMRDALIGRIYEQMRKDKNIFFISADMGAPALDMLRKDFKDRFINVGIAEQNLINVSTGLALEGFTVYAYAIAAFLLRAYEQIRINLGLTSCSRKVNVNLIGVGSGVSYDLSGPSHHCLEDLTIMRALPNLTVFSPSDWLMAERFLGYSINIKEPKYIRLDGRPLPLIYDKKTKFDFDKGFYEIEKGKNVCVVCTGYMTQKMLQLAKEYRRNDIGIVDVFLLKPIDENRLFETIKKYSHIITLEESFINKGGLDSLISSVLDKNNSIIKLTRLGFEDKYVSEAGNRDFLYRLSNLGDEALIRKIFKY